MRLLESTPARYDAGMRLVTFGRVARLHDAIAAAVPAGARVLEVGCGTGAVTARLVEGGASVTALDQSAEMLARARDRLEASGGGSVVWLERTASEIDALPAAGFDAVVMSLCLSEMSRDERRFVLSAAARLLGDGGVLLVADEVRPRGLFLRALHALLRGPQWLLAWLLAGSVSRPVPDLAAEVAEARFVVRSEQRWLGDSLSFVRAEAAA
jgi:demethylmenaquinone methyltransferase/2-methoxy-6-polyprenyl-1,4-benzoquinol methylase